MTEEEAAEVCILPLKYWTPEFRLAPGCLLWVEDSNFSEWNRSFLMSGLAYQQLVRYDPEKDQTEIVLDKAGRVHDIAILPGGDLVIVVDEHSPQFGESGRIIKLTPGN
jgi:glucose/arabinose dehydrogenase